MKWLIPLFFFSFTASAQNSEVVGQLEELIEANEKLLVKAEELEALQKAKPSLELEPLEIIIDKQERIFVNDRINGTLKLGDLSYDVVVKIDTDIVMPAHDNKGFGVQLKAAAIQSYELTDDDTIEEFTSAALAIETVYYHELNINFILGPRLYGMALGVDLTEHFGGLLGLGSKYDNEKTFFVGLAFDF